MRVSVVVAVLLLAGTASSAAAQASPDTAVVAMDTASLASGRYARMSMRVERTIFKVDVLELEIRFGQEDARRFEELAVGRGYSAQIADSIADVAIHSQDAFARIVFIRDNVSLDQFIDGVREDLGYARLDGIISPAEYTEISDSLPIWFGFLEARHIRKGDQIHYRIRGDTLHTKYQAVSGEILLDHLEVDASARLAVLGSYYARKSSFRGGLVKSVFEN
jgi:hypothetical protein